MNKKLKRINDLIEGLLGLSLLGSAYGYNTGSTANYNYQSVSGNVMGNTTQVSMNDGTDLSSFGLNGDGIAPMPTPPDGEFDVDGEPNTFLRFNSAPSFDNAGSQQNISGMSRNFATDEDMVEILSNAVSEGLGNYEEENNTEVDVDSLKVEHEDVNGSDSDTFNIVVILNNEYDIAKCQSLIDSVIPVIETLDVGMGDLAVTGSFDTDLSKDVESDDTDSTSEFDTTIEEPKIKKIKGKYQPVLRFKVVVSR